MNDNENKIKEKSNKQNMGNSGSILSSYLSKDVLEEIDINDSSKTKSLSKNCSSDKSM